MVNIQKTMGHHHVFGKSTISMAMFNSYVSLTEGSWHATYRSYYSKGCILTIQAIISGHNFEECNGNPILWHRSNTKSGTTGGFFWRGRMLLLITGLYLRLGGRIPCDTPKGIGDDFPNIPTTSSTWKLHLAVVVFLTPAMVQFPSGFQCPSSRPVGCHWCHIDCSSLPVVMLLAVAGSRK